MSAQLLTAAIRLADVLTAENAALASMDMAAAARMLPEKIAATDGFAAAQKPGAAGVAATAGLRTVATRLQALGLANRTLLERAMAVQNRVLGTLAQATRGSGMATGYGRTGTNAPRSAGTWALCSQA